jgi:hypothetical protein
MIETDPALAIKLLEGQYAKIERLDPGDLAAIDDAQSYLRADAMRVFGAESPEYLQIWKHDIVERYFPIYPEDELYLGDQSPKVKDGIAKTLERIARLIDRAKELATIHSSTRKANPMGIGLEAHFGTDFVLVKPNGEEIQGRGIRDVAKGRLLVEDEHFPVEVGDIAVFTLPNSKSERYDVVDTGHQAGPPGSDLGHYNIKLRHVSARPGAPNVVHSTTTYNNSGQVGAMGSGATATGNTIIGEATQWNGVDRDRLTEELGKLKATLLAEAGEDDDASAELGPVGEASKALKAGDEPGFRGAMKKLGAKAWGFAHSLGLAYLDHYCRVKLGLPPAGGT